MATYPAEVYKTPKAWAERLFDIAHWYEAPHGGHFAAMEQPAIFAEDLRRFRGIVR